MRVDVVVVSFNSREHLRAAVVDLVAAANVIVVDNASTDGSPGSVADLPIELVELPQNIGFAGGVNAGARRGDAEYVLLLNPDARIDAAALELLVEHLESTPSAGIAGPHIIDEDGRTEHSLRTFPRLRTAFARAFALHRIPRIRDWSDELIRDEAVYATPGSVEWLSGACLLTRRTLFEQLGGLDESFFMYSEDVDFCRRVRDLGYSVDYLPSAVAHHVGGASAPRASLLGVLTESRLLYAKKHRGGLRWRLEALALAAEAALRVPRRDARVRSGQAAALRTALRHLANRP